MKKSLFGGLVVALALAWMGSDASAALKDEASAGLVAKAGARHGVTLAKAKKRKRPSGGSSSKSSSSSAGADDASGGDDDSGKSASASSDSSDDAKEDAVLGTSSKKKKAPAPTASDDGDSSGGGGGDDSKGDSKSVETVSAKASAEEPSGEGTPSALEFGVGAKAMFRQLAWTADAKAAGLGPYNLTPGPETGLWLEFYPGAFGGTGFAANVGLIGRFDYGFGVATTLANGANVATSFRDFFGGVKVRIPMGTFTPNVSIAYGQQVFEIAQQQNNTDLPQLAYQFVRPALGTRMLFAPNIALDATVGYLMVLDAGSGADHIKSARFFPKTTSYGIDAAVSLAVKLTGSIGVRAGVDFRQYGLALHPDSSTRAVAGAVDRYIVAWAGLEVVLDGQGGAASDDEPAKPSKRSRRRHAEPKSDDDESSSSSDSEDSSSKSKSSDEE